MKPHSLFRWWGIIANEKVNCCSKNCPSRSRKISAFCQSTSFSRLEEARLLQLKEAKGGKYGRNDVLAGNGQP